MQSVVEQILIIKSEAKLPSSLAGDYKYLPDLLRYLDLIEEILKQGSSHPKYPSEQREKIARGFGRLITEDYDFSQTEFALKMTDVINDFCYEELP